MVKRRSGPGGAHRPRVEHADAAPVVTTAPTVTLADWKLKRPEILALVRNYVGFVRTSGRACFDLACIKRVPPGTLAVSVDPDREECRIHPIHRPPASLVKLARFGAVLIPLYGLALFATEGWPVWLILFSIVIAGILIPIGFQSLRFARATRHMRGVCNVPAPVRAFLLSRQAQWLTRKEEAEKPFAKGIRLFFGLVGGPIIDRIVAERASEFASGLAEAAAEHLVGKVVDPELECAAEALVDETYAWLHDTYDVEVPNRLLRKLSFDALGEIDLTKPRASRA